MTLPSHLIVGGLLRAAAAVGGNGAVLVRGDRDRGAIFSIITHRGGDPVLFERVSSLTIGFTWNKRNLSESRGSDSVARFIADMKRFDSDFWAVELDVPNVEQFIVDSLATT